MYKILLLSAKSVWFCSDKAPIICSEKLRNPKIHNKKEGAAMKVCTTAYAVTARENYFSVATNCVEIRLWFVTDSILRIRAGFDGEFAEESYSLVMTAWELSLIHI